MAKDVEKGNLNNEDEIVEIVDNRKSRSFGLYQLLAVFVVCVTAGILYVYTINKNIDTAQEVTNVLAESIRQLFQESSDFKYIAFGQLDSIRAESKLVVSTAFLNVRIYASCSYDSPLIPNWIEGRPTEVEMYFLNNRVQYIIPTDNITTENLTYNPISKTLVIEVPSPVPDRDIIEVQTMPALIECRVNGNFWHPRDSEVLTESIKNSARAEVYRQAFFDELALNEARANAHEVIVNIFSSALENTEIDIEVIILQSNERDGNDNQEIHTYGE